MFKIDNDKTVAFIKELIKPIVKELIETTKEEFKRQIKPCLLSSKEASHMLGLKSESALIKRKNEGKYFEGWHYIIEKSEKKYGNISWHRDNLLLEEFDKSKGIAK